MTQLQTFTQTAKQRRWTHKLHWNASALELLRQLGIGIFFLSIARGVLPDGLAPFACAAMGAAFMTKMPKSTYIFCMLGALLSRSSDAMVSCAVVMSAAWSLRQLFGKSYKRQVLLCVIFAQLMAMLVGKPSSAYDLLMGSFAIASAALLFEVYCIGLHTLSLLKAKKLLNEDEVMAICIVIGSAVLGFSDYEVFGLYPAAIVALTLVMLVAHASSGAMGAGLGVVMGIMMGIGGNGQMLSYLGLVGLLSGAMRKLGRAFSAAAAMLGCLVLAFYTRDALTVFTSCCLAAVLFLAIPNHLAQDIGRFLNAKTQRHHRQSGYLDKLRNLTTAKLQEFSNIFEQMGSIFSQPVAQLSVSVWDTHALLPICDGCAAKNRCWSEEGKMRFALEQVVQGEQIPFFLQRCARLNALCSCAGVLMDAERNERDLNTRLQNATMLAGKQLTGLGQVIASLCTKIEKGVHFDEQAEAKIFSAMHAANIPAKDVVVQYAGGRLYVSVQGRVCDKQCEDKALHIVTKVMGRPMRLCDKQCQGGCRFAYTQAMALDVVSGVVQKSKSDVCGDCAIAQNIGEGRYLLCISDGMGSGAAAKDESYAAISLLKRLYVAGIERDVALEAVNRLLLLRSSDEMYSTLDVCSIDLLSGYAELCKLGATPTYWLNCDGIKILSAQTLPAGILEKAEPQIYAIQLSVGDCLVMMSDGAHDCLSDPLQIISQYVGADPQISAKALLEYAIAQGAHDDITVLVAKLEGSAA